MLSRVERCVSDGCIYCLATSPERELPLPRSDDIAALIERACWMEATARKPGNVHPEARFADLCYEDFVVSAKCAAGPLSLSGQIGVGRAVLDAIRATQAQVKTNTNLGIALLFAPMTAVPSGMSLHDGIDEVLKSLTPDDARSIYEAIRLAHPGGMGQVAEGDLSDAPPDDLLWAMGLAADRDWIARQYVTGFRDILDTAVPLLAQWRPEASWEARVIHLQLELLARWPDSLIARKCGSAVAEEASVRARSVLAAHWPDTPTGLTALHEFDTWLRSDGHRRNPGTTADAIAATLFAGMRESCVIFAHIN